MARDFNYYTLLGVTPKATLPEIKSAYRSAVAKYHPDVNQASNAENLTALLNEAWATLQDPIKKAEYDAGLESASGTGKKTEAPPPTSAEARKPAAQPTTAVLLCERCGEEDVHQRFVVFYRVVSFLFASKVRATAMRLCTSCRSHEAWVSALYSSVFGLWSFPAGIVHTIRALYIAISGGSLDKRANASMLIYLANSYAERGKNNEAATILDACYRFQKNRDVAEALQSFKDVGGRVAPAPATLDGQYYALACALIPLVAVALIFTEAHLLWLHWSHTHQAEVVHITRQLHALFGHIR